MPQKLDQFNMVIVGTGGQGLITLLRVLAEAAVFSGWEVKTSELHGLSQRGGSVEVHIRFGKKIYSPLVSRGKADLIVALEAQESLRAASFADSQTNFLINKQIIPIPLQAALTEEQIMKALKQITRKIELVPASELCRKEVGTPVVAGIYLISLAVFRKLIPLKADSVLNAIKKMIPGKYFAINKKAFAAAKKYDKK